MDATKARADQDRARQLADDAITTARATSLQQAAAPPVSVQNSTGNATAGPVQTLKLQAPDGTTTSIAGQMDIDAVLRTLQQAGLNVART
jgi:hypothetical protein